MTKKKLNELVLAACLSHNASKELTTALDDLTAPKAGGGGDVGDYTVFNSDGVVEYVFCTYHKKWEPIAVENEDETITDIFKLNDKSKNGYERECIVGASTWKEATKVLNATKQGIMADLLEEAISGSEAKELLKNAEALRTNRTPRADGLGEDVRPGSDVVEDTEDTEDNLEEA